MMNNISAEEIKGMDKEEFLEYISSLNRKFRNLSEDDDVFADMMSAGTIISPNQCVKDEILEYLCSNLKTCEDDISCAAMTYYTIINLHLFGDGNGRTSRYLFDVLAGNDIDENAGYYYHKDSSKISKVLDNFEDNRGLMDPSFVNNIPDDILSDKFDFIPKDLKEKYSFFVVGYSDASRNIDEVLPKKAMDEMSKQEISDLNRVLQDSLEGSFSVGGTAMLYMTNKKNELDKWKELEINNLSEEEQKSLLIVGRFCFPFYRRDDLIADWTKDDFIELTEVGNEVKCERLKTIIDVIASPELFINKDTGISYKDEIINDSENKENIRCK